MNTIQQVQIKGKNVLLRLDTDVDIKDGVVVDDARLMASIPTIKYLLENGAKVTIIGHIGRPNGKEVHELKILPVEDKLIELLGTHTNWQILENLRFNPGEEKNDPEFTKQLATGQDIFVQDAFASCHREHSSTVGVTKLLPSYAGLSIQKEIENLTKILTSPEVGFTIIIGGKKVEDKLPVISNLFDKAENFLIGGMIANTLLAAKGFNLGKSVVENKFLSLAEEILNKFGKNPSKKLLLPVDLLFSKSIEKPIEVRTESIEELSNINDYFAVDIGIETTANFIFAVNNSQTIFWNGNMGITEVDEFNKATWKIAEAVGNSLARKYAGGGDTANFIRKIGLENNFDFISTGGGAALEFLAGKELPGLEALGSRK